MIVRFQLPVLLSGVTKGAAVVGESVMTGTEVTLGLVPVFPPMLLPWVTPLPCVGPFAPPSGPHQNIVNFLVLL